MNLKEVRDMFIELSGRYDFSEDPSKADFYIRGACIDLDWKSETGDELNLYEEAFAIGDYKTKMEHCRSIQNVWAFYEAEKEEEEEEENGEDEDEENGREREPVSRKQGIVRLEKKQYDEMVAEYPGMENTTSAPPAIWSPNLIMRDPKNYLAGTRVQYKGVIIMPPTDAAITLRVYGVFHSLPLYDDLDENYWTVRYPQLLITATLRVIEGFYRNTQGYNDYTVVIDEALEGLDKDVAEQSTAAEMKMKG